MKTVSTRVGLDATVLKLIGVVTMTIDHIGYILFPKLALLRIIGRLAYPIFAYLIAEGCTYSRHKTKYFLSVLGTGLLCSVASYWAERSLYQSIMITFACSIGLIFLLERARTQRKRAFWSGVFALALTACFLLFQLRLIPGFMTDYGFLGIITPLLVWLGKGKREKILGLTVGLCLIVLEMGGVQGFSLVAVPLLVLYSGKRGKYRWKAFFYLYYPIHLAMVYGIARLM